MTATTTNSKLESKQHDFTLTHKARFFTSLVLSILLYGMECHVATPKQLATQEKRSIRQLRHLCQSYPHSCYSPPEDSGANHGRTGIWTAKFYTKELCVSLPWPCWLKAFSSCVTFVFLLCHFHKPLRSCPGVRARLVERARPVAVLLESTLTQAQAVGLICLSVSLQRKLDRSSTAGDEVDSNVSLQGPRWRSQCFISLVAPSGCLDWRSLVRR